MEKKNCKGKWTAFKKKKCITFPNISSPVILDKRELLYWKM